MAGGANILIIDDEPDITTYFSTLLSEHGYNTRCANRAEDALKNLETSRPDLILLDLLMPEQTGISFYRQIKNDERYKDIPVVMVTGIKSQIPGDMKAFFDKSKSRKPHAFLEKPVNPDELVETVKKILQ
jgi:CheY-like chemotaxis protein